jgi:hypothetical protein
LKRKEAGGKVENQIPTIFAFPNGIKGEAPAAETDGDKIKRSQCNRAFSESCHLQLVKLTSGLNKIGDPKKIEKISFYPHYGGMHV